MAASNFWQPDLCLLIASHLDFFELERLRKVNVFAYKLLTTDAIIFGATQKTFPLVPNWPLVGLNGSACARLMRLYFHENKAVNRGLYETNLGQILRYEYGPLDYPVIAYTAGEMADMMFAFDSRAGRAMLMEIADSARNGPPPVFYMNTHHRSNGFVRAYHVLRLGEAYLYGMRVVRRLAETAFWYDAVTCSIGLNYEKLDQLALSAGTLE